MDIVVSIVNYNTWDSTEACIDSILDSAPCPPGVSLSILVHDNGIEPPPMRTDWLESQVAVHSGGPNVGFGAGHNHNFERGEHSTHFFVLNPDTTTSRETVIALARRLDSLPKHGAIAPQLLNPDGTIQASCRHFPSARSELARALGIDGIRVPGFPDIHMSSWNHDSTRVVDQPAGAALMFRSRDFRSVAGFSSRFPMYFEDVDLCQRVTMDVGPILFAHDIRLTHGREGTAKHFRTASTFWIEWSRRRYHAGQPRSTVARSAILAATLFGAAWRFPACWAASLLTTDEARTSELRAKAKGYGYALLSAAFGTESQWRKKFL